MWLGTSTAIGEGASLRSPTDQFEQTEPFQSAEPLTIRVRGVNVAEDADPFFRGDNDLIVVTKTQFNDEPPVQRLHYLQGGVEPGWQDDFFTDIALGVRDLEDPRNDLLTLRIQVYDVDGIDRSLIDQIRQLADAGRSSVLLPELSGLAGFAAMNAPRFLQLIDSLDDHDQLLEDRITLTVTEPQQGEDLLQPGYLVCFDGEPPEGATLQNDTRVHTSQGPYDGTYAVFQVERENHQTREQEISQKAAKLMAELNGKGQSDTKSSLEFLTETLRAYDNYQRIQRARELAQLMDPTQPQQALLDDLRADEELQVCFEELPAE